ncbi:unnamed protein product, partial [Didymodactylos carnosus]
IITQVILRLQPAFRYVNLYYSHFKHVDQVIQEMEKICTSDKQPDYLEALIFKQTSIILVQGYHTETQQQRQLLSFAKHFDPWYYKIIEKLASSSDNVSSICHCVPYYDYIFRYNYGAFWMASYLLELIPFGQSKLFQFLFGSLLTTKNLFRAIHFDNKSIIDLAKYRIIQDIYTPFNSTKKFLDYILNDIVLYPIWLCPIKCTKTPQYLASHYSLEHEYMINIGIYGRPHKFPFNVSKINKKFIELMIETNSRSMLYAQCWHSEDQFETLCRNSLEKYEQIKVKYNSQNKFFDLFDKVTLNDREKEELEKTIVESLNSEKRLLMNITGQTVKLQIKAFC